MTPGDWIGIAALAVAPTLAFAGAIYRAGRLTRAVDDLTSQVAELKQRITALEQRLLLPPRKIR